MTAEELDKIRREGDAANELLSDDRFQFFREYLRTEKEKIVTDFVNNKIKKTIIVEKGEQADSHIIYERGEQEREMSGKFKFIFQLIDKIQEIANLPKEAEKAVEKGRVVVTP